jgi:hypothetical protein
MPTLVHITGEKNAEKIRKAGISIRNFRGVVYFMPVVRSFFISYQWLRELRRWGQKNFVAITFRLSVDELVWAGKYLESHRQMRLGDAIADLESREDPLGYEMYIDRKIGPKEVTKIRLLPQKIGWRYFPNAHGKKPCGCPACQKGSYNSAKLQKEDRGDYKPRTYSELKSVIATEQDANEIWRAMAGLQTRKRRENPEFLERVLAMNDQELLVELAITLGYYRHENSQRMLRFLESNNNPEVQEQAKNSLAYLTGRVLALKK